MLARLACSRYLITAIMSEDDNSASTNKDKDSTLLLTKDGQRYYVSKSGVVDSRNVTTPHEPENNVSSYDMDDPDEESDVLDTSDPRDGAASPEELNDEEASEGDNAPKQCTYEGCTETTTQVAKQRKPWMCKKHRNKMYKDKYKKKKSDQAMSSGKLDVRLSFIDIFHTQRHSSKSVVMWWKHSVRPLNGILLQPTSSCT